VIETANATLESQSRTPSIQRTRAEQGRYLFIDAMRGLAALAVVLFHVKEGHHIDAFAAILPDAVNVLMSHGHLGVEIFFVLSGFVIAHSMCRHEVTPRYVGRFFLRRSIRLDPPYWASMALVVVFGVLSTRFIPGKTFDLPGPGRLLAHVFYLQVLLDVPPLNGIYWTLCLEIQYYLAFAVIMLIVTGFQRRWSFQIAFASVIVPAMIFANLWPLGVPPFQALGFVVHWHLFIAGVLVWWALHRPQDGLAAPLAAGNLVLLALASVFNEDAAVGVGVAAAALFFFAGRRGALTRWLSARPFQALGAISYSLYLVHNPITGAAFRMGYALTGHSVAIEAMWFVLVTSLCIGSAYVSYRLIERPSLALSHKIRLIG
jgi:peptidoglycan/LPS O-acetylase OafA/YrhL